MADEAAGIEGTKEFLDGVGILTEKIILRAKDGIGVDDAIALLADKEVRAAVAEVIDGAKKLPAEARDLTLDEGLELTPVVTAVIAKIIRAARAPKAA